MNKLIEKLTGGRSPIKGMRLLLPVEGTLFRVTVISVDFRENKVKARVAPIDGVGEMHVDPEKLIDDTAAARDLHFRRNQAKHYREENRLGYGEVMRGRNVVSGMIDQLPKKLADKVHSRRREVPVNKMDYQSLSDLYEYIVKLKFSLGEDDPTDD